MFAVFNLFQLESLMGPYYDEFSVFIDCLFHRTFQNPPMKLNRFGFVVTIM